MAHFTNRIPDGDTHERAVCDECGYVAYENPKIVVGSVVVHEGKVLLCRRAIEPRRGYWTLPAGYLELQETVEEGARREALEESGARIMLDGVLAIYSISRIGQVQVIFRARFDGAADFEPGIESLDVQLFDWADIPWGELAFPSVHWSLHAWHSAGAGPLGAPAGNPPTDRRGVSPETPTEASL
jgi:ADP-ribose pyrophosphatase YjhB (NUDIX family)